MATAPSCLKPKPLMLKDFLREDPNSDSSSGFRTLPRRAPAEITVRHLLEVELLDSKSVAARDRLLRHKNKNPLTKISAVLNAVRILPFASSSFSRNHTGSKQSILTRSFSRKLLRKSFWKKRVEERTNHCYETHGATTKPKVLIRDIIRRGSFSDEVTTTRDGNSMNVFLRLGSNSPAGSSGRHSCSCSSSGWSENGSLSGSDSVPSSSSPVSSEFKKKTKLTRPENIVTTCQISATGADDRTGGVCGAPTATSNCLRDSKEEDGKERGAGTLHCACNHYEEKEQLSPVSVLDFSFEEEEEEEQQASTSATPPSYHQSLAKIENTRHHLLEKIRRFENLAHLVEPIDLDLSFESEAEPDHEEELEEEEEQVVGEEEAHARELLEQLKSHNKRCWFDDVLLLDFFIEGLSTHKRNAKSTWCVEMGTGDDRMVAEDLMSSARDWVDGQGTGSAMELQMEEMKRDGRWTCFGEEEEETTAGVENGLLGSLLEEILQDLLEV